MADGTKLYGDVVISATTPVLYFGDPNTDGSWRIIISSNMFSFQRRESGVWVEKSAVTT